MLERLARLEALQRFMGLERVNGRRRDRVQGTWCIRESFGAVKRSMLVAEGVTKGTLKVNRGDGSRGTTLGCCRIGDGDGSKDLLRRDAGESAARVIGDWYWS